MLLSVHLTTSQSGIKVGCWLILQTRPCTAPTLPRLIKVEVQPALRTSSNLASSTQEFIIIIIIIIIAILHKASCHE